jgi:hypothetical protein
MQMSRKFLSLATCAALLSFSSFDARAAGGCGPGMHPDRFGVCRPNRVVVAPGPVVVAPGPVVVGPPVVCGPGLRWHPGRRRCWAY